MKDIIAPDFPTGGIIYGYEGVKKAFLTGRGKILLRSKVFFEKIGGCYCLIIKEKEDLKDLKNAKEKAHIIKGFYLVLDNIETVIEKIMQKKNY